MAHEPKLEIYKLKLSNKNDDTRPSFRDVFRTKLNTDGKLNTLEKLFRAYHQDFVKQIDLKYTLNKTKAFTLAKRGTKKNEKSHISNPFPANFIITGVLKGGIHGRRRSLGKITNVTVDEEINEDGLVADKYFFLIYTPIDHCEAVLMIQSYTEIKISDVVRNHFKEYFYTRSGIRCEVELFVPQDIIKKYLDGATFSSLNFSTGWFVKPNTFGEIAPKGYELEVKIQIIDKSKNKTTYKIAPKLMELLSKSIFKPEGGDSKELVNFEDKQAKMVSKGKPVRTLDFANEKNLNLVINLKDEGIPIGKGGVPDFDQIEVFCRNLLIDVTKELMPRYAVEDI